VDAGIGERHCTLGHQCPAAREALGALPEGAAVGAAAFSALLDAHLPSLGPQQRGRVADAAAIGAYRAQADVPVVETLVVDAAPQFAGLTADLALCWLHEGRHYKKPAPHLPLHRARCSTRCSTPSGGTTGSCRPTGRHPTRRRPTACAAPSRISSPAAPATATWTTACAAPSSAATPRLRVLDKPHLPIQNNPTELAVRQRVRRRDVSFGARSPAGLKTWDVLQTIIATAKQLGVDVWAYLHDRVSGTRALPALADLIRERTPRADCVPALAA